MIIFKTLLLHSVLLASSAVLVGCGNQVPSENIEVSDHEGVEEKGPNNGRLLSKNGFAIEVTIYEAGVEPQFRLYPYMNGKPISPNEIKLSLELERLGNVVDVFNFKPEEEYLLGDGIVTEPHSFIVSVAAQYEGETYNWKYESLEGRTQIADEFAAEAGIKTEVAKGAEINLTLPVTGQVSFAPEAISNIRSPYVGRVTKVFPAIGDEVQKGDVLAQLENISTLQSIAVRAPFDGVVLERNTNVGDVSSEAPLFVIGDPKQLEAQLHIFSGDIERVKAGQAVFIKTSKGIIESEISSFFPIAQMASQSAVARVPLPDNSGLLTGMRINGDVVTASVKAPLAVRVSALQRFRDFTVVFAKVDETYEVRMLELGRQDREWVEVLGGLASGTEYVTENSFLLKADVEKDGASHDH